MFKLWKDIVPNCVQDVIIKDKEGNIVSTAKDVATIGCIPAVYSNLINFFLAFAGLFGLVILILGGFKYMNSAGDPKKLESARGNLIYGTIGILMVVFSFFIIQAISDFTGVKCILKFGFGCE